ncbi:28S ribosomal protein S5, mitochondrial [Nowakowskiella sp. JEL0407]|nr:28S ribosomal protein S5, mitochondrial [Nowakowskiella sp. JEL0407]
MISLFCRKYSTDAAGKGAAAAKQFTPREVPHKRVLHMRRVTRVTAGGKVQTVSALVVVGNGDGAAGYGLARASDTPSAIMKATRNAENSMTIIPRFDNRTVLSDMRGKFFGVELIIRAAPPGYGVVTNNYIHEICRCAGIHDLSAKVYGSRNPLNVIKATFAALLSQRSTKEIAKARGLNVIEMGIIQNGGKQ